MNHLFGAKSAGRDSGATAAAVTLASGRDAAAEVGAGDRSFDALRSARSVALSRTCRHVKRTGLCGIQLGVWLAGPLQPIGIAEASGLHFLHRRIYGWRDGTA